MTSDWDWIGQLELLEMGLPLLLTRAKRGILGCEYRRKRPTKRWQRSQPNLAHAMQIPRIAVRDLYFYFR